MIKKIVHVILNRPYFIYSFLALFVFLGINGYFKLDQKLFPNSNRPEIAVVLVQPGSSAKDMAAHIAIPVEKELYTIDYIRKVSSTTIDEVTVVRAEFEYEKDLNDAALDVSNTIDKLKSQLPQDIKEPQIHKISAATAPIITIGISSSTFSMIDLRELIEDDIKSDILKIKGVANVDIFGGYTKELQIILDINKINALHVSTNEIVEIIKANNQDFAIGNIQDQKNRVLLKSTNKADALYKLENLEVKPNIRLKDIAKISFTHNTNNALYRGNSKDSIALAVQRNLDADVVKTIEQVEDELKVLKKRYPELSFEITDTQKTTIVQSNQNMLESLRDAIIMSTIVVFIFLASFRQILVVLLTIPVVYLSTIALMWLFGLEFNIITLTAIILALGLLLDDTVVVVENIQRHYENLHESMEKAVEDGTTEIMFADFSGTLTTMIALFPILFVGDYPQTIFGPLITTLLLALTASYIISITLVPLISKYILKINTPLIIYLEKKFQIVSDAINNAFSGFFTQAVVLALKSRWVFTGYIVLLLALFFVSVKVVMPLVGKELMPAMDTGSIKIKIATTPNISIDKSKEIVVEIEKILKDNGQIISTSASIGSEAGVLSIGSGGGANDILILANYINRFERSNSIWEIEERLKRQISKLEGIKTLEISDAGATAMASIKANIDVTLYGDDFEELYKKAQEYEAAMNRTQGIVTSSLSWHMDMKTYELEIDTLKALNFGISNQQITRSLQSVLRGAVVSTFDKKNKLSLPVRIWVQNDQINSPKKIESLLIQTPLGEIPLNAVAKIKEVYQPNIITREGLSYTIDIFGFRKAQSISRLMENFAEASRDIVLPEGITMKHSGDIEQFNDSSIRIIKSVAIGIVLIFLIMIPLFNSVKIPLMIIFSIPLTVAGASWILLIFDYHSSMSAMVGFILLAGVIVNNAILLIHFASEKLKDGADAQEAMIESIKVRTRPVLMTAISVSVGMVPVAFGWAIGIERLAPLAAVVIGGLIVGTFLTLLFIPLLFILSMKNSKKA
ncbi:efflux RND transporter permease subunit [Sulfurimonas marina]|uniref:Efflux RND transporter permease subunit n=1 Tax=Sulfurimonas marina TaxID=2590551 RepID=A0A7M1AVN8_9BACT|nr:efflux RND transporter permease subunit [Sulfurimonas marina]QOP41485.1 efflux RND transporter permease subunit [Sulfurimonas marina]